MSTARERRKGLISKAEQVKLLVAVDDKINELDIAWCLYSFVAKTGSFEVSATYCPLTHDSSIDHAIKKSGYRGTKGQISSIDIAYVRDIGYAMPRKSDPIEKWKTTVD